MKNELGPLKLALILCLLILCGCIPVAIKPMENPTAIPSQLPLATPTPLLMITGTPTPYLDMWTTFSNPVLAVSLEYPADWQPVPGYGSPEMGELRYGAINGFFLIGAMDTDSIEQATAAEAEHKLRPYGSQPSIEALLIQGQEARLILPSADQPAGMQHQAAIIIRYPQPVNVIGMPCRFFILYADYPHIRTIAETLHFLH
jgi:TolB protein